MLQQITRIFWPVITGILIALLIIREFPELTGRTRGTANIADQPVISQPPKHRGQLCQRSRPSRARCSYLHDNYCRDASPPLARDPILLTCRVSRIVND